MAEIYIDVAPYMFISSRPEWYHEDYMTLKYMVENDNRGNMVYNGPQLYHHTTDEEATMVLKKTFFSIEQFDSVEQLLVNGGTYACPGTPSKLDVMSAIFPANVAKEAHKDKRSARIFHLSKSVIKKFVKNGGHVYKGVAGKREIFILTKRKLH